MADEPEKTEDGSDAAPKKSKKGLILVGSMLMLLLVGYLGATMAVPADKPLPQYQGPFVVSLNEGDGNIQVNLAATDQTVYLLMKINAQYDAYNQEEVVARIAKENYRAYLMDALLGLTSKKTPEALASADSQDAFMIEIRDAIDPVLFPVQFGEAVDPLDTDAKSGLRPGDSWLNASLRGRFYDHKLYLDVPAKTIRLDDGEEVGFVGDETDLAVPNSQNHFVFVNTTMLVPDYVGELNVGVKGRTRKILRDFFVTQ